MLVQTYPLNGMCLYLGNAFQPALSCMCMELRTELTHNRILQIPAGVCGCLHCCSNYCFILRSTVVMVSKSQSFLNIHETCLDV